MYPQTVATVQCTQPNGQEHGITQSHDKPLIMVPHSLKEDAHASQLGARPSKAVAGLSRSYSPNPQRFCPPAKKVAPNRASASNLAARRQPCVREERCHNPKKQVRKGFLALTRPIARRRIVAQMTLRRTVAAYQQWGLSIGTAQVGTKASTSSVAVPV